MIETVLFDLDGTLTDSGLGITKGVQYALGQLGYAVPPRESLFSFIGPPLHKSFQRHCGVDEAGAAEAVRQFRVYYNEMGGILENEVYPGVRELLRDLRAAGKRLMVATSKPQAAAEKVMRHFGLDEFVPEIIGGTDDTRNTKGKVIAYALREYGVDPATAIMVGDREHDILGAAENNIPAIGITWGYGDRAELETAGAEAVFDTPAETVQYILRGSL
ncbi:MAG: HAD-IA family hydrolase [Oscillospiraceae bacterium]|nr:HAD-IA family hydrolase [Oscillospiraceae bacterium]